MCNNRNVLFFADKLETYRISSNNSRGWLFLFSHKKEAMTDYFKYYSLEVK